MLLELKKGDSLEGSGHTPMYNTHILPLNICILYSADICLLIGHVLCVLEYVSLCYFVSGLYLKFPPEPHLLADLKRCHDDKFIYLFL